MLLQFVMEAVVFARSDFAPENSKKTTQVIPQIAELPSANQPEFVSPGFCFASGPTAFARQASAHLGSPSEGCLAVVDGWLWLMGLEQRVLDDKNKSATMASIHGISSAAALDPIRGFGAPAATTLPKPFDDAASAGAPPTTPAVDPSLSLVATPAPTVTVEGLSLGVGLPPNGCASPTVEATSDNDWSVESDPREYVPGSFEGPEKNLEVCFTPDVGHPRGCRALPREALDAFCAAARCTILSSVSNSHLDAYVLSESSLFVFSHKMVIKVGL